MLISLHFSTTYADQLVILLVYLQCFKLLTNAFDKRKSIVVVTLLMCVYVCVCAVFEFVCLQTVSKQRVNNSRQVAAGKQPQRRIKSLTFNDNEICGRLRAVFSIRSVCEINCCWLLFTLISIACCLHLSIWLMNGKIKKHLACRVRT